MENFLLILQNGLYGLLVLLIAWIGKKIADWRTTKFDDDYEIEEKSNNAVGIRRAGLYLGLMFAMAGVLMGSSQGFLTDLWNIAVYGVFTLLLLFIARWINDAIILAGINNDDQAQEGNAAVGIAEFGQYIATGLIVGASISGDAIGGFWNGIYESLVFFAAGQLALIILAKIYQVSTSFNVVAEIRDKNESAAIMLAGKLIAIGIILRASIIGPSTNLGADLTSFLVSGLTGVVLLLLFNKLVDYLFLPNTNIKTEVQRDRNMAAVIVTQCATIGFAIILAAVV